MTAENRARWAKAVVALGLVAGLTVVSHPAAADDRACGQVVTASTTLTRDVGPCSSTAIIIGADNVTLDLGGHQVFGTGGPGEGAGILASRRTNVEIRNGTVRLFDAGVAIEGGTGNRVRGIVARDNIGVSPSTDERSNYGDGIAILSSTNNLVEGNTVVRNGPFSGIGLFRNVDSDHPRDVTGPTTGNVIRGNDVRANNICRTPQGSCDDDGIRLEPGVQLTLVEGNRVQGSGLDGVSIFRTATFNTVRGNVLEHNGHHRASHRLGDGVRVFSDDNLVENNKSFHNGGNGIVLGFLRPNGSIAPAMRNRILNNETGFNQVFDLRDVNPGCDNNVWSGNTFRTADPACTTG